MKEKERTERREKGTRVESKEGEWGGEKAQWVGACIAFDQIEPGIHVVPGILREKFLSAKPEITLEHHWVASLPKKK